MQFLAETFRVLGDETRLRLLRVLMRESLNVGELTRILGLAQPTVSKHLAELKKVGLVEVHRNSGFSYYRVEKGEASWHNEVITALSEENDPRGDLVRLAEILRQRQELSHSGTRFVVPGRSWVAWSRAMGHLIPRLRIADFGCGDGAFSLEMASWAQQVFAIDSNPDFLRIARKRGAHSSNLTFLCESMVQVSLPDGSVDLVTISQSLHYVSEPFQVLREAYRVLVPGGRVLLLDLLPHREKWVRRELKHRWMGFPAGKLRDWLKKAGFSQIVLDTETKQPPEPFRIIIATALKEETHAEPE